MKEIKFIKAHGLGNDFVIIQNPSKVLTGDEIKEICDRRLGVGCDQLIILESSTKADVRMKIYNPDASVSGACGNATRCVAKIIADKLAKQDISIEVMDRVLTASVNNGMVAVNMGMPEFAWENIPMTQPLESLDADYFYPLVKPFVVNVGNPHIVFFVKNIDELNLADIGKKIENDKVFPQKINVSFAQIISPSYIKLRVWERGAGLTAACGTAACATAIAYYMQYNINARVRIAFQYGDLFVDIDDDFSIKMTGPAKIVFSGEYFL